MAANVPSSSLLLSTSRKQCILLPIRQFSPPPPPYCQPSIRPFNLPTRIQIRNFQTLSCLPLAFTPHGHNPPFNPSTKLFVSGLSFRTTEDSLRNAFKNFGNLIEVMDRVANRPRGFAFLRYATEEESNKAIQGMHGKFLDGRVIFVEVARPRSDENSAKPKAKT
ncbi:PREDICTED: heterogeneous nuclear ribonucleoprotein A3 homolog 1 isoform X2 [Ipomoea nil]|uniref:heterogeneous nuclear ribonucleoprotein A3 homolog 1 isoform X2 n=1 Tax=Ipomoea nil TaxID=35883 RepID=UPI000900AD05|nr:PREDICTED: heterogeneous nuclear ribonucleoprotein A3 homolog 1 isoform X2 [Ipomoea nil]